MSIPKCNCKNCPDRSVVPNCHTTCKTYIEYTQYLEERRQQKLKVRNNYTYSTKKKK